MKIRYVLCLLVSAACCWGSTALQADDSEQVKGGWGLELEAHFRDSDAASFPVPFPFTPDQLPVGQSKGRIETVDAGQHAEISALRVWYKRELAGGSGVKLKVDLYDRYDRNPTSEDREWDIDEAWFRLGPETEPGDPHEGMSAYAKLGKFAKFERNDDRRLVSYGLVSTAFNRMEDVGLELGFDLGRHLYVKASYTQGNPLFFRDPNALAGDNGTEIFNGSVLNPDPELKTGLPIFYDADVEDLDFAEPETGLGVGLRLGNEGAFALDVLAWIYDRDLADTIDFEGTFYGGDADLLRGPFDLFPFSFTEGASKREYGANVWLYAGDFFLFGQYVDQDLAGLARTGYEVEAAWDFELPVRSLGRYRVFSYVAPVIRFSRLDPEYSRPEETPLPSAAWQWQKLDLGVRLGILDGIDLTLEYSDNEFIREGVEESADEFLATLRWQWQRLFTG